MAARHSFKLLLFFFLVLSLRVITMSYTITTTKLCHDHERSALLHLKNSLFPSSNLSAYSKIASWKARGNSSSDCCSWDGVECDHATGYVIGLDLSSSLVTATLHSNSTLFSLVHLQDLNLADNDFMNSSIPPEIFHLSSLSSLDLSFSSFSGQIPLEWSGMAKLTSLDVSSNNFYGDFPNAIFNLPSLVALRVMGNRDLSGYLPEFNKTSSLRLLDVSWNNFSGNIPASIGNLQFLTRLRLRESHFSGSIPTSIGNLTELTYLSLAANNFNNNSGDLSWLHKLTKLSLLNLQSTNLTGDIPPSLANLTQLTWLSLSQNQFNNSRNLSWLDKLSKLTYLGLQKSSLYGVIPPSLANMTELTHLDLIYNYFVGEIPSWLMNMTQLIELDLASNKLTGQIPRSISQLKNLEHLSLSTNNFKGTVEADTILSSRSLTFLDLSRCNIKLLVPHHINFTLPKLGFLDLSYCKLPEFPYFLQFQSELMLLDLEGNNIHGNIPHWIWNASNNLEVLILSSNYLTAFERNLFAIPSKSLKYIDISSNLLQGNLPVPPPSTNMYSMNNNRLTGNISPMICGVKFLKVLDLSNNNMSGPIPKCLANSLEALVLQDNNFSGEIPQMFPKECDLKVMDLSQNQLTGKIPKSLSNCKMLKILDISNNRIKQTFPTWLGTLRQLQVLLLHSNKFHGAVGSPRIASEFPLLSIINLSHNYFIGSLPMDYIEIWSAMKVFRTDKEQYIKTTMTFEMNNGFFSLFYELPYFSSMVLTNKGVATEYQKISNIFTAIDLSSNEFTGQIPDSLGSLKALQLLDLSNNDLTGPIPLSLGNLTQLESLDLSLNKLSGVIPQQLAARLNFLAFFNVSNNFLSGHIPQGPQFKTFDNNSYMENSGLCGFPLSKNCGTVQSPPDENENDSDEDKFPSGFDWFFILPGVGSGLVVEFVLGNILTNRYYWLIDEFVQNFGRTQKNRRRLKRQNIQN